MPHIPLNRSANPNYLVLLPFILAYTFTSKADFDKALETKDKYVLIYAYTGEMNPNAEAYAPPKPTTLTLTFGNANFDFSPKCGREACK